MGGTVVPDNSTKKALLEDHVLYSAKSEQEILSWANGKSTLAPWLSRFDSARTERFDVDGKSLLVLLASRPRATTRMDIYVYVDFRRPSGEHQWSLLLVRYTNTADVKVEADKKAKQLVFRSKAGKALLILPLENVDLVFEEK